MTVVINGTTGIDTGTGSLVAADSTTPTYLDLFEDTDNGSNYVRLIAPTSVASNKTITLPDTTGTVALTSDLIGVGQTWQNLTSSRALATNYTNSTGRPLLIAVATTAGSLNAIVLTIDGVNTQLSSGSTATFAAAVSALIPAGSVYRVAAAAGTPSLSTWYELR